MNDIPNPSMPIESLLARCNEFRRAGGAEEIAKLEPGIPKTAKHCLIARNLNFSCAVSWTPQGSIITSDDERLDQVAEILGLKPHPWNRAVIRPFAYLLPVDLSRAALDFDQGRYPSEYYSSI